MKNQSLLVELFTEELPPTALKKLGTAFTDLIATHLKSEGHLNDESIVSSFASPRRLACHITDVAETSPDKEETIRLLPAKIGLDENGQPSAPLLKKLESLGLSHIDPSSLEHRDDGKQVQLYITRTISGKALSESVNAALNVATTKLPIPKVMSYQRPDGSTVHFVRPAHKLVVLHGDKVVPAQVLGLESDRITLGHRFLSEGVINIETADTYETQLHEQGKVVANFEKRRSAVLQQLDASAKNDVVIRPDDLIDEVTALVEWPVTYEASFDEAFLEVPQECLILTMQANQKYFALTDQNGKMRNRFLLVSNLETPTPNLIVGGNERVLRARLADAKFFFDQDRKKSLESRLPGLANVVYHNKLGTQKERNSRLVALAGMLAADCKADKAAAERAALLCKADLLTDMVGEFPELQGNMGEHYAKHDGESAEVAQAIADHYSPRFAGDNLPRNPVGLSVALADKLETLVGIYGIGLIPTGDKDPFALRRHALGVIRMIIECDLSIDIKEMLSKAADLFSAFESFTESTDGIFGFILDRLRGYLKDRGYTASEIESVLTNQPAVFNDLIARLEAVRQFAQLPESEALAAANKRIGNILKKANGVSEKLEPALLKEPAEQALATQLEAIEKLADSNYKAGRFTEALSAMAPLKTEVDSFFEHVMVMDKDEALKNNRLALLKRLHTMMNKVADISELAT